MFLLHFPFQILGSSTADLYLMNLCMVGSDLASYNLIPVFLFKPASFLYKSVTKTIC